jgi:hypothetical protein
MKQHDPGHLTTIGAINIDDPRSWDPNLINVDFTNIHVYPDPKTFEYLNAQNTGNYWLEPSFKRLRDEIYLYDNHIIKPYLISETSFPGENSNGNPCLPYPNGSYGDEQDGLNYLNEIYPLVTNSLGSGFGWWDFQNKWWYGIPNGSQRLDQYNEDYFGILRSDDPDPSDLLNGYENGTKHLRKLAAQALVNYKGNPPPVQQPDYGPITQVFDINDSYYNPYNHPVNNSVYYNSFLNRDEYGTVSGKVVDQYGNPIIGAIILGASMIGIDPLLAHTSNTEYVYHTFSDINGDFTLRAYDYLATNGNPDPQEDKVIVDLKVSAYGSEWVERGWVGGQIKQYEIYTLQSLQYKIDNIVTNKTIYFGSGEDFTGYSTISAYNDDIMGSSNFSARNSIDLKSNFFAKLKSDVHFYIDPLQINCNDIQNLGLKCNKTEILNSGTNSESEKEVEINFFDNVQNYSLTLFPNPCQGSFSISINGGNYPDGTQNDLFISDCYGKEITHKCFFGNYYKITINNIEQGIYFVLIKSNIINKINKLIIN